MGRIYPRQRRAPHRVLEVDAERGIGVCSVCGPGVRVWRSGRKRTGGILWLCKTARNRYRHWTSNGSGRRYRWHKALLCQRCGFVPEHRGQLDVHHKDGDHSNNDPSNLETLCANCHRLVELAEAA